MDTLRVELAERSYPIFIGPDLLSADNLSPYIRARQILIVTNETIAPLYLSAVKNALQGFQVDECILPDGEQFKTLDTVNKIYDVLLNRRHNRTTTIVALGGGVIGDMAGFAAATYQRGVRFIQIPTTLLSQVDSSVGGKTGVNHPAGKNMIGAFYQPAAVVIDTATLAALPDVEFAAGMAEVIKYGLIADADFYAWINDNKQALKARQPEIIAEAIRRSCQSKADVVAADEREAGVRATLNLGHTFGHAIETAKGYGEWLHGEAVAAGTVVAARLSQQLGWLDQADVENIITLFEFFELPVRIPSDMSSEQFLSLMKIDKKAEDGRIKLVLLEAIGSAIVTDSVSNEQISVSIESSY